MKRVLLVLFVLIAACGKRGDPKPPVPVIPQATSDLVVTQRADKVLLSWSYPSLTTAGKSLAEIRRISVYRYVEVLPVSPGGRDPKTLQPGEVDPTEAQPIALFARVPALPEAQFVKLSTKIDSMERANIGSATAGAKLLFTDRPPLRSADGRPVRLTYAVVTEGAVARSAPSNLAIIVPLPVAVPPADVKAEAKAEGVTVSWSEPSQSIGNQGAPVIVGYNIFRSGAKEEPGDLAVPVNSAPVKGTMYTDVPPYGEHAYRVSAVASDSAPLLQSELSAPATVTFRDLVPPPAPAKVTALIETSLIRLVWDPVSAPDLAGYNVYRWERDVRLKLCCPTPNPLSNFLDISMELGITYRYEVTAVDKSGNESAPAPSDPILIPKTP